MKKVWKYTALTFLLLLGLCCVGVLYLFFIPNAHLFNITYINNNSTIKSENYVASSVNEVVLNSRAYNVNVLSSEENSFSVEVFSNAFGFVLSKHENTTISSNLKNGILTFDIHESYGFALKNNSYVNLYVPKNKSVNLNLSNLKAKTIINSSDLEIKDLSYSTTKGDFDFVSGKIIGNLDLSISKSKFTIHEEVETNLTNRNNVNISLTSGKFDASKSILGDVDILSNKNGIISINECTSLETKMTKDNSVKVGGQIYITKVGHIELCSGDTIVEIGEINNGATVELTKSGTFKASSITGHSSIFTNSGNIYIGKSESTATLHSESGSITVSNAQKRISVNTNSGKVSISFDESAPSYLDDNTARVLFATIHNGSLYASGVQHIGPDQTENSTDVQGITITGSGTATIYMDNVYGNNSINANNGSIKLITNTSSSSTAFNLTTSSSSGSVRVNLLQIPNSGGYTTTLKKETPVNGGNSSNTLTISSNKGSITVLDSILNDNGF